jgi:hypothetical protein
MMTMFRVLLKTLRKPKSKGSRHRTCIMEMNNLSEAAIVDRSGRGLKKRISMEGTTLALTSLIVIQAQIQRNLSLPARKTL